MLVIPSIDLMGGRCVQLVGGDPSTRIVYGDPIEWAQKWMAEGAELIHVVDLDSALGSGDNSTLVKRIVKMSDVPVQVGGGIRSVERAIELTKMGVERIVIGTAAVERPQLIRDLVEKIGGERVVVALDSKKGKIVVHGWKRSTGLGPLHLAKKFEKLGIWGFLYTIVDVEGRMSGLPIASVRAIVRAVDLPVIASGGAGSLEDIRKIKRTGAYGLVIGMALYEGRFTLRRAIEEAKR
jgi:phosphoribosylformimino-5-aminoimidazole carboxamide ribotide isomerase